MKLEAILSSLNSLEKNSFIKIVDGIISNSPKNKVKIEKILNESDKSGLKNMDNLVISKIFSLVRDEFSELIKQEFLDTNTQLDITADILTRDGNCILSQDWFAILYAKELKHLEVSIRKLKSELSNPKSTLDKSRLRDYKIYKKCVSTAFTNDKLNNRESKITDDELSILITLAECLDLSHEEVKLINYMTIPVVKREIVDVVSELKAKGLVLYSKKNNKVYVPDEVVKILREIRGKEVADKYFRRVLSVLKDSRINLIARKYNIDRKLNTPDKIREIIKEGIPFRSVLKREIFKEETNVTERKKFLNDLWSNGLKNKSKLKGITIEEKVSNFILYFDQIEHDEKVGISVDGYEKLLNDLNDFNVLFNQLLRREFEIQEESAMSSSLLLSLNVKPIDLLDLIPPSDLLAFCKNIGIKTRGNIVHNVLDAYKDSENLYLENYENIGFRNYNELKEKGIVLRESEIGLKFEELTSKIFSELGFHVDEDLKKKLNSKKDKMDILINLGSNELIIVECKTKKDSGFNKFSSVSRQMKSYANLVKDNDMKVVKTLLVAPEFSDDFVNETELEYDLNLSLIEAGSLMKILKAFKNSKKHKKFPYKLLLRDVLIKEDRIIKAIEK